MEVLTIFVYSLNTVIVVHLLFPFQGLFISYQRYIYAYILHMYYIVDPEMVLFKSF